MPFYTLTEGPGEQVTPKYSSARGNLATGEHVEVGLLSFAAGTGAVEHRHPHEQFVIVLKGRLKIRIGDEERIVGPMDVAYMPSGVPHQTTVLEEDALVLSCKHVIDGVGHRI